MKQFWGENPLIGNPETMETHSILNFADFTNVFSLESYTIEELNVINKALKIIWQKEVDARFKDLEKEIKELKN